MLYVGANRKWNLDEPERGGHCASARLQLLDRQYRHRQWRCQEVALPSWWVSAVIGAHLKRRCPRPVYPPTKVGQSSGITPRVKQRKP
jgi:hypothetical protein